MDSDKVLNTTMELLEGISYGYIDQDGNKIINSMDNINKAYRVSSPSEVLENKLGSCFDKVELERTIFSEYFDTQSYALVRFPMVHSFIVLNDGKQYIYFEQSSPKMRGIYKFSSLDELLGYVLNKYIDVNNIKNVDKLSLVKYDKLETGMTVKDLMKIFESSTNILHSYLKKEESNNVY